VEVVALGRQCFAANVQQFVRFDCAVLRRQEKLEPLREHSLLAGYFGFQLFYHGDLFLQILLFDMRFVEIVLRISFHTALAGKPEHGAHRPYGPHNQNCY